MIDGPRNGVWMKVNPFGQIATYFCAFQGIGSAIPLPNGEIAFLTP